MLSRFAKALLVATSMAPVLCGYGFMGISAGQSLSEVWHWFAMAGGLTLIAFLMPIVARQRLAVQQLDLKSVKDADKEILTFLITYLLPLAGRSTPGDGAYGIAGIYVFAIIFLCVYHTNAFTFNPLLAMFGYHFFEVETKVGMKYLLMTKRVIRAQEIGTWAIQLADYVYLEGEEPAQ